MTISKIPNSNSYPTTQDQVNPLNTQGGTAQATPSNHSSPTTPSHHYHPSMIHDQHQHLQHGNHGHHHHTHHPHRDKNLVAICTEAMNKAT